MNEARGRRKIYWTALIRLVAAQHMQTGTVCLIPRARHSKDLPTFTWIGPLFLHGTFG